MSVRIKRVYDDPDPSDGTRVLVDRLWPRGMTKEAAAVDHWLKDVAPSNELRKWFHADTDRFYEFRKKYLAELKTNDAVDEIRELAKQGDMTLVYGARDPDRNHALVLLGFLGE